MSLDIIVLTDIIYLFPKLYVGIVMNFEELKKELEESPSLSTRRGLSNNDILRLENYKPTAKRKVRVYSCWGFVPNSYKYPCRIQWCEWNKEKNEYDVGWSSAQRAYGRGSLTIVDGRGK